MPSGSGTLPFVCETALVQLPIILGGDDADLVVFGSVFPTRVVHGVDMKARSTRFPNEKTQTLNEFLLQVVV